LTITQSLGKRAFSDSLLGLGARVQPFSPPYEDRKPALVIKHEKASHSILYGRDCEGYGATWNVSLDRAFRRNGKGKTCVAVYGYGACLFWQEQESGNKTLLRICKGRHLYERKNGFCWRRPYTQRRWIVSGVILKAKGNKGRI